MWPILRSLALLFITASNLWAQSNVLDARALAKAIDAEIAKQLDAEKIPISPRTDDAEFLRRVSLDIAGVIPTAPRVVAFLQNSDPEKRAKVIDELLAGPEYPRQMMDLWKELLIPTTSEAMRRDQLPFVRWLYGSFAENKPLDKLFRELLTANGMQDDSPATTFFIVHESVDMLTDRVGRSLMGLQIQCAQCHDHPFADWKQKEYWAFAGFFSKVGRLYERTPQARERYGASEQAKKTLMVPDSAKKVPPKFLRGDQPKLDASKPYLPVLAEWMTAPENPYFPKAMVNRVWYHLFGKGLVNPVDNMIAENPATHPELLSLLSKQFVAAGFDVRFLIRAICLSDTYQRSSRVLEGNQADTKLYSHMPMRVLLPLQLHDSWQQALNTGETKLSGGVTIDTVADKKTFGGRNGLAAFFTAEEGSVPTDYKAGIPQALRLMNSKDTSRVFRVVSYGLKDAGSPAEAIDRLFLITVSRHPSAAEVGRLVPFVAQSSKATDAYGDILWALLNSTEFVTNH